MFPRTRIGWFKNTETEIEFTERGCPLQGTLTGRGGDLIIIDDPIKPADAVSEPTRTGVNQWYLNTVSRATSGRRSLAGARAPRRPREIPAATRLRHLLGPVPAGADAARRGHDQAHLGAALSHSTGSHRKFEGNPKLGHGFERRR